jgi:hypothetical protein
MASLGLLALLVVAARPASAGAVGVGFTNKMKTSIVVEAAGIVRGNVVRSNPLLINPGKMGGFPNIPPGQWRISIYDANQPSRLLYRGTIPIFNQNLFFNVHLLKPPPAAPRAKLVPTMPPK